MKFFKGLFFRLFELEIIVELFFIKFFFINSILVYIIIFIGCMFLEFFELLGEVRIYVFKKYNVFDESINFFSVLCKYGEREEFKLGVIDCFFLVFFFFDSGSFVYKINFEDRKRKFISSFFDVMYDFKCFK